jgi:hypothetical protein
MNKTLIKFTSIFAAGLLVASSMSTFAATTVQSNVYNAVQTIQRTIFTTNGSASGITKVDINNGSGISYFLENVGIHTTQPKSSVQVVGNIIFGDINNWAAYSGNFSSVLWGMGNHVETDRSSIAGWYNNNIVADADHSFIWGGWYNTAHAWASVIGWGEYNTINNGYATAYATIGWGRNNSIMWEMSTIGWGGYHTVTNSFATIAWGYQNGVNGNFGTVGGGKNNVAAATSSTIAWGDRNSVTNLAAASSILWWSENQIWNRNSAIAWGWGNIVNGVWSFLWAGEENIIEAGTLSFLWGGRYNTIKQGNWNVLAWGTKNFVGGHGSAVLGWEQNILSANYASINGGRDNSIDGDFSTIWWGNLNVVSGAYSTVPGWALNIVVWDYSLAWGHGAQALHNNTFVWNDGNQTITSNDPICQDPMVQLSCALGLNDCPLQCIIGIGSPGFASTDANQFIVNATNGVGINTNAPAAALQVSWDVIIDVVPQLASLNWSTPVLVQWPNNQVQYVQASQLVGGGAASPWEVWAGLYSAQIIWDGTNQANGMYSIAAWWNNNASGDYSTIVGWWNNSATWVFAFIWGWSSNWAFWGHSVVVGGALNAASADHSFIGWWSDNAAGWFYSFIGGWGNNWVSESYSFIGWGRQNRVAWAVSSIVWGVNNLITGYNTNNGFIGYGNFIGWGVDNTIISNNPRVFNSSILGWEQNTIEEEWAASSIVGWKSNYVRSWASSIVWGEQNIITASGVRSHIWGGKNNWISQWASFIGGGISNQAAARWSVIGGWEGNQTIDNNLWYEMEYPTIGGWRHNEIAGKMSTIAGWFTNKIYSIYSTIVWGRENEIQGGDSNFIWGGYYNKMNSTTLSSIIWWQNGRINGGIFNTIVGGDNNEIWSWNRSVILGWSNNVIAGSNSLMFSVWGQILSDRIFLRDPLGGQTASQSDSFIIHATNGVGINTNTPSAALDVNGNIKTQSNFIAPSGNAGLTQTLNLNDNTGTPCTMTIEAGIVTSTTCP